jgi:hypothetical protein
MSAGSTRLESTVLAMRPLVPAKNFAISGRFYQELGFLPQVLSDDLIEMQLGNFSFILQNYYVEQWANNFVMHLRVSDSHAWWNRILSLDLQKRFGIHACAPKLQPWGLVVDFIDPSGVLWRVAGPLPSEAELPSEQ